MNRNNDKYSN